MQWSTRPKGPFRRRTKTRFLFLPKSIGYTRKWLTFATWAEECKTRKWFSSRTMCTYKIQDWTATKWIDEKKGRSHD